MTDYERGFAACQKMASEVLNKTILEPAVIKDFPWLVEFIGAQIKAILALRPEPVVNESEPVAWMTKKGGWVRITDDPTNPDNYDIPLYLHPTPNAESEMSDIVMGTTIQKLGSRLAELLDDDQWNNTEPMLLDINEEIARLRKANYQQAELVYEHEMEAKRLAAENAELRKLLEEIYNWTDYKTTPWAIKVASILGGNK